MAENRQPFTKEPVCPKCGSSQRAWTGYVLEPDEHLRVVCACGYTWEMECADTVPAGTEPEERCETCKYHRTDGALDPDYGWCTMPLNTGGVSYYTRHGYSCKRWEPKPPDTDSSNELLPCPFCGEQPRVIETRGVAFPYVVACEEGDCPVQPMTERRKTGADAIAAWNRRANG